VTTAMIFKHGSDQAALVTKFTDASARPGEMARKAVHDATLKTLQSRELTWPISGKCSAP